MLYLYHALYILLHKCNSHVVLYDFERRSIHKRVHVTVMHRGTIPEILDHLRS